RSCRPCRAANPALAADRSPPGRRGRRPRGSRQASRASDRRAADRRADGAPARRPGAARLRRRGTGIGTRVLRQSAILGRQDRRTVLPFLMTVALRSLTRASKEITWLSFQRSTVMVSPGNTGAENRTWWLM